MRTRLMEADAADERLQLWQWGLHDKMATSDGRLVLIFRTKFDLILVAAGPLVAVPS